MRYAYDSINSILFGDSGVLQYLMRSSHVVGQYIVWYNGGFAVSYLVTDLSDID